MTCSIYLQVHNTVIASKINVMQNMVQYRTKSDLIFRSGTSESDKLRPTVEHLRGKFTCH